MQHFPETTEQYLARIELTHVSIVCSNRTFDTLRNHPSFYLFNHRGRVLFRAPEQEPSTPSPQALPSNPLRLRKLENFH